MQCSRKGKKHIKKIQPWRNVQEDGAENRRRDPHASHAIVSMSTLTQPLLAQATGLIDCIKTINIIKDSKQTEKRDWKHVSKSINFS